MPLLTPERVNTYQRDGYLVVPGLLGPEQVEALREAFLAQTQTWARDIEEDHEAYLRVISQWTNLWEHNAAFRSQLFEARIAAIAAELIGCERVRVFHDHLIAKPPRGGSTIPWHRDLTNWPVREASALSCWIALDDAPVEAGAVHYMPGRHLDPLTPSIDFLNESKDWGDELSAAVPVPVSAGSAIFHHCLAWHMSPPNQTDAWRRAYVVIYLDAECTFDPSRAGWHPMARRVTAPPGDRFNEDAFPTLGGLGPRGET